MNLPGIYTLTAAITVAETKVTTNIEDLDGMLACQLDFQFIYGSGGTTVDAYAQVSLDGGATFRDVAHAAFTTAAAIKPFNVSGLAEKLTAPAQPTDGALAADTAISGMLGPIWRLKTVSVGVYGGSTQVVLRLNAK